MGLVNIEELLKRAHEKLDRAEKNYNAFDTKLDEVLLKGKASKLTPIYSLLVLGLAFWLGTWF